MYSLNIIPTRQPATWNESVTSMDLQYRLRKITKL